MHMHRQAYRYVSSYYFAFSYHHLHLASCSVCYFAVIYIPYPGLLDERITKDFGVASVATVSVDDIYRLNQEFVVHKNK